MFVRTGASGSIWDHKTLVWVAYVFVLQSSKSVYFKVGYIGYEFLSNVLDVTFCKVVICSGLSWLNIPCLTKKITVSFHHKMLFSVKIVFMLKVCEVRSMFSLGNIKGANSSNHLWVKHMW
jgi:hypothetical protein